MTTQTSRDHGVTNSTADGAEAADRHTSVPAIQVICLGSGGGPSEDNVTGFLVRSMVGGWTKGSVVAVDAGSHLAAITRILEKSFPLYSKASSNGTTGRIATSPGLDAVVERRPSTVLKDGPFAGMKFPNESARANALHLLHTYISCYLITHPHLDHLSGFAINTAALSGRSRPKTLAALPSTVDAVKRHIFNDIIWPNLSDEDGGVGFVTFQRLKHGGDSMIGEGSARGYIDVVEGIGVKALSVSHGVCTKGPPMHQHRGSVSNAADFAAAFSNNVNAEIAGTGMSRAMSINDHTSVPGTPGARRQSMYNVLTQAQYSPVHGPCVVDSTVFFLREEETAREILIFGDVEPDSVSSYPRNEHVWQEAAPKVLNGTLKAILIECSYTDAVADETLFGHLCPRHLIAELQTLAEMVHDLKSESIDQASKKRKRSGHSSVGSPMPSESVTSTKRNRSVNTRGTGDVRRGSGGHEHDASRQESVHFSHSAQDNALSPRAMIARSVSAVPQYALPSQAFPRQRTSWTAHTPTWDDPPLSGLTIIVIHVKDTFKDGPPVTETILSQLNQHEEMLKGNGCALGCTFIVSRCGESYTF